MIYNLKRTEEVLFIPNFQCSTLACSSDIYITLEGGLQHWLNSSNIELAIGTGWETRCLVLWGLIYTWSCVIFVRHHTRCLVSRPIKGWAEHPVAAAARRWDGRAVRRHACSQATLLSIWRLAIHRCRNRPLSRPSRATLLSSVSRSCGRRKSSSTRVAKSSTIAVSARSCHSLHVQAAKNKQYVLCVLFMYRKQISHWPLAAATHMLIFARKPPSTIFVILLICSMSRNFYNIAQYSNIPTSLSSPCYFWFQPYSLFSFVVISDDSVNL